MFPQSFPKRSAQIRVFLFFRVCLKRVPSPFPAEPPALLPGSRSRFSRNRLNAPLAFRNIESFGMSSFFQAAPLSSVPFRGLIVYSTQAAVHVATPGDSVPSNVELKTVLGCAITLFVLIFVVQGVSFDSGSFRCTPRFMGRVREAHKTSFARAYSFSSGIHG